MNSTAVQVIRWITRIFNGYIATSLLAGYYVLSQHVGSQYSKLNSSSPLTIPFQILFIFATVLAYSRERFAGLLFILLWLISFSYLSVMLSEYTIPVFFSSLQLLLIGSGYLVCWWFSQKTTSKFTTLQEHTTY